LTVFSNFPVGPTWGHGFTGGGGFGGRTRNYAFDVTAELVPEPASFLLLGSGLVALGLVARRMRIR